MAKSNGGERQNRHAAGTPVGGRFAAHTHAEAALSLGPEDTFAGRDDSDMDPEFDAALASDDPQQLWLMVRHGDERIRVVAASNPNLTRDQVAELLRPEQPTSVRVSAVVHNRDADATSDPSPFVRVWADDGGRAERIDDSASRSLNRLMNRLLPVGRYAQQAS